MARSEEELAQVIEDARLDKPVLADADTTSEVGILKHWKDVVAAAQHIEEGLWDNFMVEVQQIADSANYGNDEWWIARAFEWQYGDDLVKLTNSIGVKYTGYEAIDETKRIVKRAAIVSQNGYALLKVAKEVSGEVVPLSTAELSAFNAYIKKKQIPGANIFGSSAAPDRIWYEIEIYYNALLDLSVVQPAVEAAINAYHSQLADYSFTGTLDLTKLADFLQKATGVKSYVIKSAKGRADADADYTAFDRVYDSLAGYVVVDPDYPLSDEAVIKYFAE